MISGLSREINITNGVISASRKWFSGEITDHWHEFYEIEYMISGSGTYTINGQTFPIQSGMLFFMTPSDFHRVITEKTEMINVMFSEQLASLSCLAPLTCHTDPRALLIPEPMRPLFLALLEEIVQHQEDRTYAASLLDCLLLKLTRTLPARETDNWNSVAQKIHFYLMNHFRGRVSLQEVADHVGLTPAYVSAVFKKEIGRGFKKYLNDLRFAYARKLLLYTDLSVTQICGESGFEDYPNFIRRFREYFGVTPTQMRNDPQSCSGVPKHIGAERPAGSESHGPEEAPTPAPEV